jgi:WD40 repeat protein
MKTLLLTISLCFLLSACSKSAGPSRSLEVASKGLHCSALSEDGEHAIAGSIYHGASLWRLEDQERLFNWNHQSSEQSTIVACDFSDDGRFALTATVNDMVLWDVNTGQALRNWLAPSEILDVELNTDASLALLGLADHNAVIFDIRRGGIRRTFGHDNRVRTVDFDRQGRFALTGSEDYNARLWNVQSGELITRIKHDDDVQLVQLSDDGSLALSVSKYDKAIIWTTEDGELLGELPLGAERLKRGLRLTSARFNHNNQFLIGGRQDQIVQLWSLPELQEHASWKLSKRSQWKPTSAAVLDVAFAKDMQFLAAASNGFVHELSSTNTTQ